MRWSDKNLTPNRQNILVLGSVHIRYIHLLQTEETGIHLYKIYLSVTATV